MQILMLRALLLRGGTALYAAPFVALVEEKAAYFKRIFAGQGFCVRAYHGSDGGQCALHDKASVYTVHVLETIETD